MKRFGHLFEKITEFENLLLAAKKTFRGGRNQHAVAKFFFHLEPELLRLQEELITNTYKPQPYRVFRIYEPKPRQICAASVRDRVVHHAICNHLDPIFERQMISDTFACRRNKGTHAAVQRTQELTRRFPYFLKCDIKQYFASIDHTVLKNMLRRLLKDRRLLNLLDIIIDQPVPNSPEGKGLPIGNLTSQYFANLYLGQLDHYLKEQERVGGYVRYMDDFIVLGSDKKELKEAKEKISNFVEQKLCLQLKEKADILAPTIVGISFLGFLIFPGMIRLEAKKWKRFRHRVRELEHAFVSNEIDEEMLARKVQSMIGHIKHANTLQARRKFFSESLKFG